MDNLALLSRNDTTPALTPRGPNALSLGPTPGWVDTARYPFVARRFEHPDGAMHYVDEGSGRPLLFIHGTPSWSFEWRAALAHLRERYRCVAIDHLGFGLSDKPLRGAYLPLDHTRRLHDFIRALDLQDITLVVHDFGGPIATPLVVRDPSRFARVVLVNTWVWPTHAHARGRSLMRFVRSPLGRFLYLFCNASPRWLLPGSFANRAKLSAATHRQYLEPFASRPSRRAPWTLGANLVDTEAYAPELPTVAEALRRIPTAVIWGTRDRLVGADFLARARELLPNAPTFELPDAGHFPQEETSAEFLRALDAALENHAAR